MNPLRIADFEAFFRELHGEHPFDENSQPPYDWQTRLAAQAIDGRWPLAVDLPTGSGKTACLDIAVFALACQASKPVETRSAPRRVFFCVNRRVIVDEAFQRAVRIARRIWAAEGDPLSFPTLARVAAALRHLSGLGRESGPPLDALELRGGIYRDNRWARTATQPTIVCATIDQLGSRLLFRGYGVSANASPIQAALIAYDSLVLLDEAHISQPFQQSLHAVGQYLDATRWATQDVGLRPMTVVPMTATPPAGLVGAELIRLEAKDRENLGLSRRLTAIKYARLTAVTQIASSAVADAEVFAATSPTAVGIIVNRVATAKAIYAELRRKHPDAVVELVIGSMRPIDRDRQSLRLRTLIGPARPNVTVKTSFVVATQCLEVGADYDFDALVTECASLDALRQRFGRLNRAGRAIEPQAVILIDNKQVKEERQLGDAKPLDPIYGNALSRTWNWLVARSEAFQPVGDANASTNRRRRTAARGATEYRRIDFGIDSLSETLRVYGHAVRPTLLAPSASLNAPVMLPAYVDIWCQTSPFSSPQPEVALFIHGPASGEPDVQVCWRADLVEDGELEKGDWCDIIELLPPTSAECMSVPISRLRRWLSEEIDTADQGDLLGTVDWVQEPDAKGRERNRNKQQVVASRVGVLWRGLRDSDLLRFPQDVKPGDTVVLPASAQGWDDLGHVPPFSELQIDDAEIAFRAARDRAALRLHPALRSTLPLTGAFAELFDSATSGDDQPSVGELRELLRNAAGSIELERAELSQSLRELAARELGLLRERYPDERGVVLTTRRRVGATTDWYLPPTDEGEDDRSRTTRESPVSLADHTTHVRDEVTRILSQLPLASLSLAIELAADLHDLGKADERFQAMLRRADRTDVWLWASSDFAFLAKSDGMPQTRQQRRLACERAELPSGFRHEMLSVQVVESGGLLSDRVERDLILHLIAAHHGFARPFAPVVIDDEPADVEVSGVRLSGVDRLQMPPHRIDSGIADRFWSQCKRFGWWGLAYLEAVIRLADQKASADEDEGVLETEAKSRFAGAAP